MKGQYIMEKNMLKKLILLDRQVTKKKVKKYHAYLPFHLHVTSGNIQKIKKYINAGYNINIKDCWGRTAMYYAIFNENIAVLKLLVKSGGDYQFRDSKEHDNCSLLHLAAGEGCLDKVQYLVEDLHLDMDEVTKQGHTPFWYSLLFNNLDVARYFINKGAKLAPNHDNLTALLWLFISSIKELTEKIEDDVVDSLRNLEAEN